MYLQDGTEIEFLLALSYRQQSTSIVSYKFHFRLRKLSSTCSHPIPSNLKIGSNNKYALKFHTGYHPDMPLSAVGMEYPPNLTVYVYMCRSYAIKDKIISPKTTSALLSWFGRVGHIL